MKIKELRAILAQAEELCRLAGNERQVAALRKLADALAPHESKTVEAFVKLAAKAQP